MRKARAKAREMGETGLCTHAEKIGAILDLQMRPDHRKSTAWLGRGVKTRKRSDTYYFAGCLPYLDVVFREIGFAGSAIGRSTVMLLNRIGIVPAVSEGEVCCGHDAYWTGEVESVREFARRNMAAIRGTGAKRVVFSCPECYYMFKQAYPTLVGKLGFEPVFILNLLVERLAGAEPGEIEFAPAKIKVTYQDPCRLTRYDDITKEPRDLLRAVPDLEFVEMKRTGRDALCCGSSSWISCSRVNKKIQVERLGEAVATGAQTLVTACPKCNIHLRCALRDQDSSGQLEVTDLVTLLAKSLGG
jgi:Fe-S oxidoreductase